jgi:hypothetical protein
LVFVGFFAHNPVGEEGGVDPHLFGGGVAKWGCGVGHASHGSRQNFIFCTASGAYSLESSAFTG